MEKFFARAAALAFLAALFSCATRNGVATSPAPPPSPPAVERTVEPPPVEEPAPQPSPQVVEEAPAPVEEPAPPAAIAEAVSDEPVVTEPAVSHDEEEYRRSVTTVDVSRETFSEDKAQIMKIIGELGAVMSSMDYESWLAYIDRESVMYWSNRNNLRRASRMLPVRGLNLDSLQDYFTYVFVPSRLERTVDEIRYDSPVSVKAVQVQEDSDVIYYYFNKIDGKWLVHIPPIE